MLIKELLNTINTTKSINNYLENSNLTLKIILALIIAL
jgi:hypothetical protein